MGAERSEIARSGPDFCLPDIDLACRPDGLEPRRRIVRHACEHGAHRHGRRALPVLQYRNGRSYRGRILEALRTGARRRGRARRRTRRGPKNSSLFQYRPPIDLTNARLRSLASALAPGLSAGQRHLGKHHLFCGFGQRTPAPPAGFKAVLTRQQWREVIDFAHAVNARIVTSFAVGAGNRDAAGIWTPDQARRLLDFTRMAGGRIAAAEFMNEPNLAAIGGLPAGYDPAAYGRDFKVFHAFVKQTVPEMMILGPGAVNETPEASELLAASGPGVDAFRIITMERCRSAAPARPRRRRPFRKRGSHGPIRPWRSIGPFETDLSPASRSGSPKPRRRHAVETPGPQLSWIRSDISISLDGWPRPAFRS